ncbi:MAG: HNH endonuclease [Gammaproteobacteria bacterium]|nr:HNH endonuclease [Gammaproteobacteria bacterium]MBU1655234.1 HNH endonuclease [Gammaproteobacteria bacterium]MBU1961337.1 HNH endonuclease [Gammaproteobacteria bacterium]
MRIALRTSGGRGEYEIAGTHGNVGLGDVLGSIIYLQLFPGKLIETNNIVRRVQGKTRIRLLTPRKDKHIYLILADILLMPKPKREIGITPIGKLQLTENNYSVTSIQFDIVSNRGGKLVIQPSDLILANSDYDLARIDILERMRILLDVWASAGARSDIVSQLIAKHRDSVLRGDMTGLQQVTKEIRTHFDIEDPLREILRTFSLLDQYTYWLGVHRNDVEESIIEENPMPIAEASKLRIRQWRLQAIRGPEGRRFSQNVKEAYGNRCLLTGYFLPKSNVCLSSGVDSAHILPWADHGINDVTNGICLSKLCHWAFDNGIIKIAHSSATDRYTASMPDSVLNAESEGVIDLSPFKNLIGSIPISRLPANKQHWPSPAYLDAYNQSQGEY